MIIFTVDRWINLMLEGHSFQILITEKIVAFEGMLSINSIPMHL